MSSTVPRDSSSSTHPQQSSSQLKSASSQIEVVDLASSSSSCLPPPFATFRLDMLRKPSLLSFVVLIFVCGLACTLTVARQPVDVDGSDPTAGTVFARARAVQNTPIHREKTAARKQHTTTLLPPKTKTKSSATTSTSTSTTTTTPTIDDSEPAESSPDASSSSSEEEEEEDSEEDTPPTLEDASEEDDPTPASSPTSAARRSTRPSSKAGAFKFPPVPPNAPAPPWLDALKGIVLPLGRGVPADAAAGGGGAQGGLSHAVTQVVLTKSAIHAHGTKMFPSGVADANQLGKMAKNSCVPNSDVKTFAGTCAVVGNSGVSLNERYGASIDDHDIVIRFNDGPTQGFEDVVGSRTTIRVLNNKWTSSMLEGSSLSLTPRLAVNSSLLLFGKSNVHHVGSVCGKMRRTGGYPAQREVLYVSPLLTDLARLTYRRVHGRVYNGAADSAMGAPPSGIEGIFFAMSICTRVSLFGFGVDAAASKEARYHYHNGVQGDRSAHSFGYQGRFLKTLRASGRIALCNEVAKPAWATRQCKRPQLAAELDAEDGGVRGVSFDTTRLCQW